MTEKNKEKTRKIQRKCENKTKKRGWIPTPLRLNATPALHINTRPAA